MITDYTIREVEPKDYADIVFLLSQLGYPSTLRHVSRRLETINKDERYITLIAQSDCMVLGFIGLQKCLAYEVDGYYLRIVALIVNDKFRNCGIGTKLIGSAEKLAVSMKASAVVLASGIQRKEAHKFYKNKGYSMSEFGFVKKLV